MSRGSITPRPTKKGPAFLLKYEGPRDPISGERVQLYKTVHGTKAAADKELRRLLRAIDTGDHVNPDTVTVAGWAEHWLAHVAARKAAGRTLQRYGELLRGYILPKLGAVRLQRLTREAIEQTYSELLASGGKGGRPLSGRTVHHCHRLLSEMLEAARRRNKIPHNPCRDVEGPKPGKSPAVAFTPDQIGAILAALDGRPLLPVVRLALVSGMRRGEIAGLRWSDLDFAARTLAVERSIEKVSKKLAVKPPKTASGRRTVRLAEQDMALLREHWRGQAEIALRLGVRLPADAYLFPATPERPCEPVDPDRLTQSFAKLLERLNIKRRGLSLHSLRHTSVSWLLQGGADLKTVSQRIGHSDPAFTMRAYQHVLAGMDDRAAQIAGGFLDAGKKTPSA